MRIQESLMQAAEAGETEQVLHWLREGAALNGTDAQGRTPLMAAVYRNRIDTVRALIDAGADVDIRDHRQDNPLLYAGAAGLPDILKLILAAGADTRLTNRFGGTALIPACERGHVEVVEALLTLSDVDVNHVNRLGWTGLLEAVILSDGGPVHQRIVELLLAHGADVRIPDHDGVDALQHAERRGYREMVRIMKDHINNRRERS